MVDIGFIDRLKNFDKNSIPENRLRNLRPYIERKDFEPNAMVKVS